VLVDAHLHLQCGRLPRGRGLIVQIQVEGEVGAIGVLDLAVAELVAEHVIWKRAVVALIILLIFVVCYFGDV